MIDLKAILYGIIQGLAEFLPISSSGHLAIFQNIFGLENIGDMLLFNLVLHLGTLAAVVVAYFGDIKSLVVGFFTLIKKVCTGKFKFKMLSEHEKFVIFVVIATLPLVAGAILESKVEAISQNTQIIGGLLILNAAILFVSDRLAKHNKTINDLKPHNAFYIGLFQLAAIFPGISRSGMTITGGLLNKLNRESAVKFSFIMSIPAILGASVFKVADVVASDTSALTSGEILTYVIGAVTAFVMGYAAIFLLRYIAKKDKFVIFSVYCLVAGIVAVIFG